MTAKEFQRKMETWAEICGIKDKLTPETEKAANELIGMLDEYSDETIDISIIVMTITIACAASFEQADMRGAIDKVAKVMFTLDEMHKNEIAALEEKYRWRKQSEEPAPKDVLVEVYLPSHQILDFVRPNATDDYVRAGEYWRPLDVPKAEGTK